MSTGLIPGVTPDVMHPSTKNKPPDVKRSIAAKRQVEPQPGKETSPRAGAAPDRQQISTAVSALKDYVQNISRDLEFTVDEEINQVIIRVYDAETQEVIRQIPAEEVLDLARQLARSDGLLLKAEA